MSELTIQEKAHRMDEEGVCHFEPMQIRAIRGMFYKTVEDVRGCPIKALLEIEDHLDVLQWRANDKHLFKMRRLINNANHIVRDEIKEKGIKAFLESEDDDVNE